MTANMPKRTKDVFREQVRMRRARLDPAWVAKASQAIMEEILALPGVLDASVVAAYFALPAEPNLDALMARLHRRGITVCVPAYHETTGQYRLCLLDGSPTKEKPVTRRFGVREPTDPQWTDACSPDVWLIPGVAFDHAGHRLGHGKGYYDRMLERSKGFRAGVCFSFQVLDEIPTEAHDVGMHLVISEQGTRRI